MLGIQQAYFCQLQYSKLVRLVYKTLVKNIVANKALHLVLDIALKFSVCLKGIKYKIFDVSRFKSYINKRVFCNTKSIIEK